MKKTLLYITTLMFSIGSFAQEELKIDDAVSLALEHNHGIQVARNSAEMTSNNATIGNAGLLPSLNLNSGITYNNNSVKLLTGNETQESTQTNASLNLSYTIFDGFGSYYKYDKLKSQKENGELQARYNIENTISVIVNSYYQLAELNESYQLSNEMLEISADRLRRVEEQKKFGKATSLQVLNARVDYNNDSISLINNRKALDEMKRSLNVMLGREPSFNFEIDETIEDFTSFDLQQLKNQALERNTSFLLKQNNIDASQIDLKLATSAFSPRLSLSSSYGVNQTVQGLDVALNNANTGFNTGLTLSYSLFDGSRKKIQKKNAIIALDNAQLQLEEQKLELMKSLENAYANYQNSLAVLDAQQLNLQSAEMNFDISKEYYQLGQITSTQFREAQSNLQRAKNSISSARYTAKIYETELIKLSGILVQ